MINSNEGNVIIKGMGGTILADLSTVIYALRQAGFSEELIKAAVMDGILLFNKKSEADKKTQSSTDSFESMFGDLMDE